MLELYTQGGIILQILNKSNKWHANTQLKSGFISFLQRYNYQCLSTVKIYSMWCQILGLLKPKLYHVQWL